jgi:MerR family transcriptional regulator, copper efflux regulator
VVGRPAAAKWSQPGSVRCLNDSGGPEGSKVALTNGQPENSMHIGEIAELTEMSMRTLRHYDEVGLLSPSARSEGGFRLYTPSDLEKLLVIRRMKPLGYSLEEMLEVRILVETIIDQAPTPDPSLVERLRGVLDDALARRERLYRQLGMVDEFVGILQSRLPRESGTSERVLDPHEALGLD